LKSETQEPKVIRATSAGSVSRRSTVATAVLPSSNSINGNLNSEETPSNTLPIRLPSQPSSENISGCNGSSNSNSRTPLSSHSLPERNRGPILREVRHPDGSFERLYCDGSRTIEYANGSAKEISSDGVSSTVYLFNGDIKQTMEDGTVVSCRFPAYISDDSFLLLDVCQKKTGEGITVIGILLACYNLYPHSNRDN
uniref:Tcp10_C domain-containing protein n=1 Tax=Rodentolepis nana TaxID=102285 RepID=A0A0R3TH83_RODNA